MPAIPETLSYEPPTLGDLRELKEQFGLTGAQMAQLFNVSNDKQWRKYTGGQAPRPIGIERAFWMAAHQVLDPEQLEAVRAYMASFGALWEIDETRSNENGGELRYRQRTEAS
jgi:hypothetical protein